MKDKKLLIIATIVFLVVGFAAVSTNLVINGLLAIGENDFDIIFTSAKLDGKKRSDFISSDKKHIIFTSNILMSIEDKSTLAYEVTNMSRNYDAEVNVTCTAGNDEYITFYYNPTDMRVPAGKTKLGALTVSMQKVIDEDKEIPIECTLAASPIERESLGDEYVEPFSNAGTMMAAYYNEDYNDTTGSIWDYKGYITKIVIESKMISHETNESLIFDLSEAQDGSVMAYLVSEFTEEEINIQIEQILQDETGMTIEEFKNYYIEEGNTEEDFNSFLEQLKSEYILRYTLYIQSDTGVKANENCSYLFYNFFNLESIEGLENLDTSSAISMSNMFSVGYNETRSDVLVNLDLSNLDTSRVTDMSNMFAERTNLTNLDLSGLDTSNVTDMSAMFMYCYALTSLDLSGFDTSKVTTMESMFRYCENLKSLNIKNFDTINVTNMSEMFWNCSSLTELDVSSFNTSNVTDMKYMFDDCEKLISLNVSKFNTSKVTDMSGMFGGCSSLTTLNVSNFDTSNVIEMSYMFKGCVSLTSLNISSFDTSKVTTMQNMLTNCNGLTDLYLGRLDINDNANTVAIFTNVSTAIKIHIKNNATKTWILSLNDTYYPKSWNDSNFILET